MNTPHPTSPRRSMSRGTQRDLSRRDFVRGASALGISVAGAGAIHGAVAQDASPAAVAMGTPSASPIPPAVPVSSTATSSGW